MDDGFAGGDERDVGAFAERDASCRFAKSSPALVQIVKRRLAEADVDRLLRCRGRARPLRASSKLSAGTTMSMLLIARSAARSCSE